MFKQLKYFQSVVRLNSFSEAADGNYISQSAISQQIQALERELGFKLFERRNRSFTPTPAGEYFYRKSLVLTADFYSICAQMKTMIDRCLADYMAIKDKPFYLIVTAADPQHSAADETLADFRGYLRCLPGAKEAGVILGTGTWDKGDVYRHPSLEQAYKMGKDI